ncbi:MAG: sulfurtransferase complex subunit TusB [Pseudohongiellaceae bacterium]
MSSLHTISHSQSSILLESCLRVISENDAILFIEDGVYHCCSPFVLQTIGDSIRLYGLREDMLARATLAQLDDRVEAIDNAGFVQLCCSYDKVVSWF